MRMVNFCLKYRKYAKLGNQVAEFEQVLWYTLGYDRKEYGEYIFRLGYFFHIDDF